MLLDYEYILRYRFFRQILSRPCQTECNLSETDGECAQQPAANMYFRPTDRDTF